MSVLERYVPQIGCGFRFTPDTYINWFTAIVIERYAYFASHMSALSGIIRIPSALDIFIFDIDSHGTEESPMLDFAIAAIAENLHRNNSNVFPDPSGYDWQDEHEAAARQVLSDCWDNIQETVLHDMELVLRVRRLAFRENDSHAVVNNPITEVW